MGQVERFKSSNCRICALW